MFTDDELAAIADFISASLNANDIAGITQFFAALITGDPQARKAIAAQAIEYFDATIAASNALIAGLDAERDAKAATLGANVARAESVRAKFQALAADQ